MIVEGLPNCVAVDRSKLKHTSQTRILFNISRSCFSVLGSVVETWCKFKSVAILLRKMTRKKDCSVYKDRLTKDILKNWPNCETRVQPASVFLPPPRRNRIDTHKYIRLTQLDWFPTINQGVSSRMFGKMHRYRIYFWFFCIKSWGYSTNCEKQSTTFDPNAPIKYIKHRYSPTVNKNGHLAKVVAGVWSTGSRRAIKGYDKVVRFGYHEDCYLKVTYINSFIVSANATSDKIKNKESRAKLELTYISNSLSTSSGVTSPWTSISGGLCCSIREALIPRSVAGPLITKLDHFFPRV